MDRRTFLKTSVSAAISISGINKLQALPKKEKHNRIRIGICADLHQDVMHDGPQRMGAFIKEMEVQKPDFIIQLGDFCRPYARNQIIMDIWNRFSGPRYHVIGNHDMDGGFSRDEVVAFWNAIDIHYSFDRKGYHFVVLDGNDHDPKPRPPGYNRYISKEQLQWLETDLEKTTLPVIVFCHQGLDRDGGITNATQTRLVLERANAKAGYRKVQLVFTGHHHQNYHNVINGIHYVEINSMSYYWLGDEFQHIPYSKSVSQSHPYIKYTAPYKEPLWATVDIFQDGTFRLKGNKTEFVGLSPEQLGMPAYKHGYPVVPFISDRKFDLTMRPFEFSKANDIIDSFSTYGTER